MPQTIKTLVLPGYGNSGPDHWQSIWEASDQSFMRVMQDDWEHPEQSEWLARLDEVTAAINRPFVIAAHSLGCLLLANWAKASLHANKVKGALLVAVPDPDGPTFPAAIRGFSVLPTERLPFPSIIVGSNDDPYASLEFQQRCAERWGSRFIDAGSKGHLNASSGLGAWEAGRKLLQSLSG